VRELRRAAEPAALGVAALRDRAARRDHQRRAEPGDLAARRALAVVLVDVAQALDERGDVLLDLVLLVLPRVGERDQHLLEARPPELGLQREVGPEEVRLAVGRAPRRQRPAAA